MKKPIVGMIALAVLVSGCANQYPSSSPFWPPLSASVPPPTKRPALAMAKPTERIAAKKKRVADKTPPRPVRASAIRARKRKAVLASRPKPTAKPKPAAKKALALNQTQTACQEQRRQLPADADTRSATIGVQCFFISRGEYLTKTGAVKPLR